MSMHGSNISKSGITNKGDKHEIVFKDKSDSHNVTLRKGSNIKKQSPGMNTQIVPPVPVP